ncbi:hypothetical protein [Nocardioides montaniterrae]
MQRRALAGIALALFPITAANADDTEPSGDTRTSHIADLLRARERIGLAVSWYAHAEKIRIPAGHGRCCVAIFHADPGQAWRVARDLRGTWYAKNGRSFVQPYRSWDWTAGGTGDTYRQTAQWARKRLGVGWTVVAPV